MFQPQREIVKGIMQIHTHRKSIFKSINVVTRELGDDIDRSEVINDCPNGPCVSFL